MTRVILGFCLGMVCTAGLLAALDRPSNLQTCTCQGWLVCEEHE